MAFGLRFSISFPKEVSIVENRRETTEDEVFLTRAVLLPLAPGFLSLALEAGLSLPPAKKRPFFNQRSIYSRFRSL